MSDEIDTANDRALHDTANAIRAAAKPIEPGVAGICNDCDEASIRLIEGLCAQCRDIRAKQTRLNGMLFDRGTR